MSEKCPKCYNSIDDFNIDRTKINRARGGLGLDENGDPLPFWSDDPTFTPLGLSGDDYKGIDIIRHIHFQELREYYNTLESDLGLDSTVWTDDLTDTSEKFLPKHIHIEELRQSIENLLSEKNLTIVDYFALDRYGNSIETTQTDWTDVDRDNEENLPLLPSKTLIKAIHIEELRRGIYLITMFLETWTDNSPTLIESDSHSIIQPPSPEPLLPMSYGFNNTYSPVEADNIWYEMNHNFNIRAGSRGDSISGETSINLSGGNLIYQGNIILDGGYSTCYGNAAFSFRLLLGEIPPDVKRITSNRILSWSGSWNGLVIPEDNYSCYSRAYILLHLYELEPYRSYLIYLVKIAEGSSSIATPSNTYLLTSWAQELNLYNVLNTMGLDVINKRHYINFISFQFAANCPFIYIGRSNYRRASIEGSIDNIKIE